MGTFTGQYYDSRVFANECEYEDPGREPTTNEVAHAHKAAEAFAKAATEASSTGHTFTVTGSQSFYVDMTEWDNDDDFGWFDALMADHGVEVQD
jgi:hypothetical protein